MRPVWWTLGLVTLLLIIAFLDGGDHEAAELTARVARERPVCRDAVTNVTFTLLQRQLLTDLPSIDQLHQEICK